MTCSLSPEIESIRGVSCADVHRRTVPGEGGEADVGGTRSPLGHTLGSRDGTVDDHAPV